MEFVEWNVEDYLDTPDDLAEYINAVIEMDDPLLLQDAVGIAARARGMSEIAQSTELSRESLYRAFSSEGNPRLSTVTKVLSALGLKLRVSPIA